MLELVGRALGFSIISSEMARAVFVSVAVTECHPLTQRTRERCKRLWKMPSSSQGKQGSIYTMSTKRSSVLEEVLSHEVFMISLPHALS